ncbi:MAG TPA: alanine--tRNA ligase [Candidatus Aerophobetes bacterium]|uniref:Alanine--tRNA ligase n=1 Tax=Aerophobetes bacterium TaxID=2030807 RepID=A0A7V5HZR2_UNCAE|nr:alanine--tRNA ligase [Candidatus Aerophobetes bacterium]
MKGNEIRSRFLDFFRKKGHLVLSSSPLTTDDPELLFTIAGMVPFKPFFLGEKKPPSSRITSCQLCFRTNDLERVGETSYHHTFFEMLGNFSFGDYFKEETCRWAVEFITKDLDISFKRLWVTVFKEDEETVSIWKKLGFSPSRIIRKGEEDNFWMAGEVGPCGPDTEIFFDRGEELGCKGGCEPGCNRCSRWVEIWNLVFMQYKRDISGNLSPLPTKNVDTGMGLERVATVVQRVDDDYHTDLFYPLYKWIKELSPFKKQDERALRVISDHLRGLVFLLEEGIMPSNVGRGYVVRRVLRRAFRYGRKLGLNYPFLHKGVPVVVEMMGEAYPQLREKEDEIVNIIKTEEEIFQDTLSRGLSILEKIIKEIKSSGKRILPGEEVFKMYDTYGFPLDITREIAEEAGIRLDEEKFKELMEEQRKRAKVAQGAKLSVWDTPSFIAEVKKECPEGKGGIFVGYEKLLTDALLLCIVKDGRLIEVMGEGEEGDFVFSETPFYPEGGGQVADKGSIFSPQGFGEVIDVKRRGEVIFHKVLVKKGFFRKKDKIRLEVDKVRRKALASSHTATHLLHAALRKVLGESVRQSGSLVDKERLRFDFTFPSAVDEEKLRKVCLLVNEKIREDILVETEEMRLEDARRRGAIALFEEKYQDKVRVVKIGDFSMEVCGGTHLSRTGEMGIFQIVAESGISAGVRRIEALCGEKALLWLMDKRQKVEEMVQILSVKEEEIADKIKNMDREISILRKKVEEVQRELLGERLKAIAESVTEVEGVKVCAEEIKGVSSSLLRQAAENLRDKLKEAVVALSCSDEKKAFIVIASSRKDLPANYLIKKLSSFTGGSGGGRWDFAQGGTPYPDKVKRALQKFPEIIKEIIKNSTP